MASLDYGISGPPTGAAAIWAEVWQLQEELSLSEVDMLALFDTIPDVRWREQTFLTLLRGVREIREMNARWRFVDISEE